MADRFPGSVCRYRLFPEIDNGTLCRHASPIPAPSGSKLSLWPELYVPGFLPAALGMQDAVTGTDKAEFRVIQKMPVYNSKRAPYRNINQYISDRTLYFGAPSAYRFFAAESDDELINTKWVRKKHTRTLRSMIEFNDNLEMQKIFYRWVRKAYKRKYGDDVNVPELIRKGMSQELADKIAEVRGSIRVKKIRDEQFQAGGFNPRPVKYQHHYLLGTLSEHGTGMAVDIDDKQNAQLTIDEWKFIEDLVDKHIGRTGRWHTEADAESLWKDINDINDLFVRKVAAEVQRVKKRTEEKKAQEEAAKAKAPKPADAVKVKPSAKILTPLEEVLGKHHASLKDWVTSGFFHLPLDLVLELHAHGFTWGATFSTNVDLHHFELDK